MADIGQFIREYSSYKSTFKITSFDDENKVNLCTDESQEVVNFDRIIENKYPDSNKRPKSFDALYIDNSDIYCIEFKNQKPAQLNKNKDEIKGKIEDGKSELDALLTKLNISKDDYNFIY